MSNPGDLSVEANTEAPGSIPSSPSAAELLPEQVGAVSDPFYTEALTKDDDPYGFTAW